MQEGQERKEASCLVKALGAEAARSGEAWRPSAPAGFEQCRGQYGGTERARGRARERRRERGEQQGSHKPWSRPTFMLSDAGGRQQILSRGMISSVFSKETLVLC